MVLRQSKLKLNLCNGKANQIVVGAGGLGIKRGKSREINVEFAQ